MNTENEIEHTPTPWELGKHGSISGGITRRYTNGSGKDQLVMVCCVQPDNGGTQQGNAAFIVRACNSHEALVAALKPFADLINWADISESDADEDAFLTGTRNDVQRICGAKTAVLTVGDLRRAKAAIATVTP